MLHLSWRHHLVSQEWESAQARQQVLLLECSRCSWIGRTPCASLSVNCAQYNITGHPSLPQRLKSQISELASQSFLCCHSRKTFLGAYFRTRGITPLPEIFTSFLYWQKVPEKGREQGPLDAFRLQPCTDSISGLPYFLVQWQMHTLTPMFKKKKKSFQRLKA